jgi:hypothetical protein
VLPIVKTDNGVVIIVVDAKIIVSVKIAAATAARYVLCRRYFLLLSLFQGFHFACIWVIKK